MAYPEHAGLPARSGADLSSELSRAILQQLSRLLNRSAALPGNDSFAGPSLHDLAPGLANEAGRR